ncbi:hypothetical protein GUITHDRAFT_163588 [Guillardia theta CCMP2712]|uniref:EF-hand domain-containing protein n=1 Tax=Guillardia theta (strain CCMP2712) TaxID=905079 RepID=L1J6R5_GUITC|nr:hypothetical protein GUITHDRAFT_163588 [Guillardia theta CCMP2712]EKX44221.1 hypothetical protein GUITHDRAFT_163588 [Guillardia theta CCMP2712]|eukprot:XP_005831201.1 hypothetical protein GUITHDRAFT_163588 [Guillardia theta CCMP2712]
MKACAPFISALCLLLIQGVNCGFCPATSCLRTGASGQCLLPNISSSFCPASEWSPYITSYPPSWWTKSNISSMNATPALGYIKEYAPCCRHCVWSLGYPLAVPLVIVISPNQDLCAAEVSKFSLCYLDCTKWAGDLSVLDTDGNGRLSYQEFLPYFTDYLVAPSQNYQLYTGGRMTFDVQFSRLNPFYVFAFIDFNNDFMVSMQEWDIFRHFWTPVLVSGAGPSLVPSDGRSLAQGPFGGFFMDEALYAIWSTNAINLMLEYYVNHRKQGFRSYDVREPESVEKMSSMSSRDLDGSGRVSMEEHYFYHFSDKNGDGVLSPEEFYSSLYRTDCKPLCPVVGCNCSECPASGVVAADCPPSPQGDVDGTDLKRNFNLHDMDKNGVISFLERKFVAADLNMDRMIDSEEWRIADYPEDYGPFLGHCVVEGSRCVINSATYNFYMSFHYCASRGSKTYKRLLSQYPWSSSCLLKVEVERLPPFVDVIQFNTSDQKAKLESEGWLCWDPDPAVSNDSLCFTGYAVQMFHAAAERLLWTYRFVLSPSSLTVAQLRPPVVEGVGAGNAEFKLALFSSYKMPWRPPQYNTSDFFCSSTLWKQDGLVVVKRSDEKVVSIEFAILMLLISPSFINFIVFCYFVMLVVGHIFWWVERRQNPDLFNKSYVYGVMDGLWFSIVTVTSVGYGDKAPRTGLGKNLTVIWMFLGMLCYGVFSSGVSEQINVAAKENSIKSVYDLSTFQVGVLESMSEPLVKGIDLGLDYSFTTIKCKDLAECEKFLLTDQTISAFVAAHSDVIAYFQSRGLNDQMCGNPMRILLQQRLCGPLPRRCPLSNHAGALRRRDFQPSRHQVPHPRPAPAQRGWLQLRHSLPSQAHHRHHRRPGRLLRAHRCGRDQTQGGAEQEDQRVARASDRP